MTTTPRQDPHVDAVGLDVTALTPQEMEEAGIRITGRVRVAGGRAWKTHADYCREDPAHDEKMRGYARLAAYLHFERQYLEVQCPYCGRSPGRVCERFGASAPFVQGGQTHRDRRQAARAAGKVTLRGLRLSQTFPCPGVMRQIEVRGQVRIVQCDVCGEEIGVAPPKPGDQPRQEQLS